MNNPLIQLGALGQSVWLDFIHRGMLSKGGELQRLIDEDGLAGVTSNPAIFEKAIDGTSDYDTEICSLARRGLSAAEIAEELAIEDVSRAADLFHPKYAESGGADGFVSIEVSPRLANDAEGSVAEARRLWRSLGRPNVMVKIPATDAGLLAIGRLLREGVNVNVTLLFAVERYLEVYETFISALEDRVRQGKPMGEISSVASFFLSRIDTLMDPRIQTIIETGGEKAAHARGLPGTIAIANAKIAYQKSIEIQASERWKSLVRNGARPQRLLWASTSTKNPKYRDLMYVEPLIAPDTISTMPLETLKAYRDHGQPLVRIGQDLVDAVHRIEQLRTLGLDFSRALRELEEEGVRKFVEPYEKLLDCIGKKRAAALSTAA